MTGAIIGLHKGGHSGGYGYIASDALNRPHELPFRQAAVVDDGFVRLRLGQRVSFRQEPLPGDPSRRHAVHITPLG